MTPALAVTLAPIEPLTARLGRDLDGVFAEVVSSFEAAVYTTALRVSGGAGDAEDLAAETFLRAYSALRGYSPVRIEELQLRPWLITICLNLWRNQLRAAGHRPVAVGMGMGSAVAGAGAWAAGAWMRAVAGTGAGTRTGTGAGAWAADAPSGDESPEDQAERHEAGDQLAALLQHLPDRQRIAVVLRHIVGLSYAEVAEVLGCPESTAKSHVRRGLDRLRALVLVDQEVLP